MIQRQKNRSSYYRSILGAFSLLFVLLLTPAKSNGENPTPNIILILADDLGYGDLSCYGQSLFQTPNIDRLANSGIKFNQHYAGSAICSPSRCSLLTGKSTGYASIRGNTGLPGTEETPLPSSELTLAEMLKTRGYTTGVFGKWGLGSAESSGSPLNHGFDHFFGYKNQYAAHKHFPVELWHNGQTVKYPENLNRKKETYAPNAIQEKALEFIEQNKETPFFCYLATTLPHASLAAPQADIERFEDAFNPEIPYTGEVSLPFVRFGIYSRQPKPHAAYAAMVTILDRQVGQIVDKLESLGIAQNTLLLFASDNGPHDEGGGAPHYFNSPGGLRGIKRDLYEGGIRTPFIASWPGVIAPATTSNHVSASWDILPTIAEIIDIQPPSDSNGISFLPTLINRGHQKDHEALFWEMHEGGGKMALRRKNWKAVRNNVNTRALSPVELYDLSTDPYETMDLAQAKPSLAAEMKDSMEAYRTHSKLFPFPYEIRTETKPNRILFQLVAITLMVVLIGSLLRHFKQSYVVAYLLGGIVLGNSGFDLFSTFETIEQLGAISLIVLLFYVGMDRNLNGAFPKWHITTIGVCIQIALSVVVVASIGSIIDWPLSRRILLSFIICISSTAIIFKILQDRGIENTKIGKSIIGISVIQDIAVIPMILILQFFSDGNQPQHTPLWLRCIGAITLLSLVVCAARGISIPIPFGKRIRKDHEIQIFMALGICFGFAALGAFFGLTAAMGAFVGGIIIATAKETEWVRTNLESFRIVFIALFFIYIGALIDLQFFQENWIYIALLALAVLIINTGINYGTLRILGRKSRESWHVAALLSQIGEFAIALTIVGYSDGIIGEFGYQLAISTIASTLIIGPLWISLIRKLSNHEIEYSLLDRKGLN